MHSERLAILQLICSVSSAELIEGTVSLILSPFAGDQFCISLFNIPQICIRPPLCPIVVQQLSFNLSLLNLIILYNFPGNGFGEDRPFRITPLMVLSGSDYGRLMEAGQ